MMQPLMMPVLSAQRTFDKKNAVFFFSGAAVQSKNIWKVCSLFVLEDFAEKRSHFAKGFILCFPNILSVCLSVSSLVHHHGIPTMDCFHRPSLKAEEKRAMAKGPDLSAFDTDVQRIGAVPQLKKTTDRMRIANLQ